MAVVNEALKLSYEVRHCSCHLNFFFGMEQTAEMQRPDFESAVATQNSLGWTAEEILKRFSC